MKPRVYSALLSIGLGILLLSGMFYFLRKGTAFAKTDPNTSEVIQAGIDYLKNQQLPDGGITGFSSVSDPDTTARSVLAFITARKPITDVLSADGNSMMDYLYTQTVSFTHDTTGTLFPGRAGIVLSAVSVAGEDPTSFGDMDLTKELEASYQPDTGTYSTTAKAEFSSGQASDQNQAWAILGLSLAGKTIPDEAVNYLSKTQSADGSWGGGDPDTTALAVTALIASQKVAQDSETIQKAIQYFHTTQAPSGGWKPSWDTDPLNADSTGWAIQALVSAGEDVRGQSWSTQAANPLDALMSLQKPDGSIGGMYANSYSTAEAILGLSGIPLSNLGLRSVTHRAGLAIFYGDDTFFTKCVSFTQSTITGLDLLKSSGLAVETATNPSQGTAVCKIGDKGSPASDCFGSMPNYWSYWQLGNNGWEYSAIGSEQSQVTDGAVNAWNWGTGDQPPTISFQNICEGVAFVLPTSVPTSSAATSTAALAAAATPVVASVTPAPTATPTPTQGTSTSYFIYAAILLVLGVLIIFILRPRKK
jgi:hypothetical protein